MKETEPIPRPAATLVIIREADGGFEVLLTKRPESLRFMGGATVFPGGAMSEADRDPRWVGACSISPEEAADRLELDDETTALGYFVCALREAFEEVGFLVGTGPTESLVPDDASDAGRFLDRCRSLGVVLDGDRLIPAGRWVTPLGSPIRFDARFFIATAPSGWEPRPDPAEVAECRWSSPVSALDELATGSILMAPPTIEMLQRLAEHGSMNEAIEALGVAALAGAGSTIAVRVSPLVNVVLAPNPGVMTGPGTNTYVVGGERKVVIDPAVDDAEYLEAVLEAAGRPEQILVTHRHPDHVGGIEALVKASGAPVRALGSDPAGGVEVEPLRDGEVIDLGGCALEVLFTPGHAPDHVCFMLVGAASLFSGDNVLGEGTAVIAPPEGNMAEYLASLERLRALRIDRIFPGHFRPLDGGTAVIEAYIEHRRQRESQIVEALGAVGATLDEIVAQVYVDTPVVLHPVARLQVEAQLAYMAERGRVRSDEERWMLTLVE